MPAIDPPSSVDFSEDDVARLSTLLREGAMPHGGFSLEGLDGFFSALIVGPELVLPGEYLPHIWGDREPEWANIEQAEEALSLVMRLWNHIARRVRLDPQSGDADVYPFLALPDDASDEDLAKLDDSDFPVGADWAAGFLHGVELRGEAWDERLAQSHELVEDFEDLEALLIELDPEDENSLIASDLSFRERMEIIGEVPFLLNDMHLWRMQELPPQEPVRRAAGPGRNDPCPCGSGKKFKKCCGDPARLH